jgi:hypothetical protein
MLKAQVPLSFPPEAEEVESGESSPNPGAVEVPCEEDAAAPKSNGRNCKSRAGSSASEC